MGEAELEKTAAIATEFMKRKHGFSTIEAACFHDGYLTGARDTKARLALLEQVADAARKHLAATGKCSIWARKSMQTESYDLSQALADLDAAKEET